MLFEFFALGAFGFWLAIAAFSLAIIFFLEADGNGTGIGAFFMFPLFVSYLVFIAKVNIFALTPTALLMYFLGYLGLGVIWGFIKWISYSFQMKDEFLEFKKNYVEYVRADKTVITAERKFSLINYSCEQDTAAPPASRHKSKIICWMTYWPWSAVWTIINDPVKRFFVFVYNRIGGLFDKISNAIFKNA